MLQQDDGKANAFEQEYALWQEKCFRGRDGRKQI